MAQSPVQRFRQRKLSTRQSLLVLRQSEIDSPLDDGTQRHIPRIETGVEKGEEVEHHLQAAISASAAAATGGKVAQIYIPTPDTIRSDLQYNRLYKSKFAQPTTYARFSSTVEDCIGFSYCLNSEDEEFIHSLQKSQKYNFPILSYVEAFLDQFENMCPTNEFIVDKDALIKVSLNIISKEYDPEDDGLLQDLAETVYDYWRLQRSKRCNRPLLARLKVETGRESDDSDPYVCFRRREVRQIRKTRGRDAHISEKIKKLRNELEDARHLVKLINQRETRHVESLILDEQIFKNRHSLKGLKRNLCIKGDDSDLISQLSNSKPKHDATQAQRVMPGTKLNHSQTRNDNKSNEAAVSFYNIMLSKKDEEINRIIEENTERHINWNKGWTDATWKPLSPSTDNDIMVNPRSSYSGRFVLPQNCMKLEPALISATDVSSDRKLCYNDIAAGTLSSTTNLRDTISMHRRKGRGGRLMLDRQLCQSFSSVRTLKVKRLNEPSQSGCGYDSYHGKGKRGVNGSNEIYHASLYDNSAIRYRVVIRTSANRDNAANATLPTPARSFNVQ